MYSGALLLAAAAYAKPFAGVGISTFVPYAEPYMDPGLLVGGYFGASLTHAGVEGRLDFGRGGGGYRYLVRTVRADGLHFFLPDARLDPLVLYGVGARSTSPWHGRDVEAAELLGVVNDPYLAVFVEAGGGVDYRLAGPLALRLEVRAWLGDGNVSWRRAPIAGLDAALSVELRPSGPADRDRDGIVNQRDNCPDDPEDFDQILDRDGCPEDDMDRDGLGDAVDQCPTRRETTNGFRDEDGCPDLAPAPPASVREPLRAFSGTIDGIEFALDSADLLPSSEPVLTAAAAVLRENPDVRLLVRGHTDATADDAYNVKLSLARAAGVVDWLAAHGVGRSRLSAEGVGEAEPVDTNDTEAGRSHNRRVEFVILDAGGLPADPTAPPPPG